METFEAIRFGQKHADFEYEDFAILQRIARLSKKHQRQCENACNGVGVVKGQVYYGGQIDLWAKETYGQSVKSAYLENPEISVFDKEIASIEATINRLVYGTSFSVKYQHDPRGYTVKLSYDGDLINW